MNESLLDTDVLSEILKGKDARVVEAADRYLAEYRRFAFSSITFYEIIRGLLVRQADRALNEFLGLAGGSEILPVSMAVLKRAAELWADAQRGGFSRNDADLIIAATALESHRTLVTGNMAHFAWIPHLLLGDWRSP